MKFTFLYFCVCVFIRYVFCMDFWFDENEVFCAAVKECFFFDAYSFCKNGKIDFDKMNSLKTYATIVSREREKG